MSVTCGPRPTARLKRAGVPQRARLRGRASPLALNAVEKIQRTAGPSPRPSAAVSRPRPRRPVRCWRRREPSLPSDPQHPIPLAMPAQMAMLRNHIQRVRRLPGGRIFRTADGGRSTHRPRAATTTMEEYTRGTWNRGHRPTAIPRSQIKINNTGRGRRRPAT
jgi:hypothetical protein